MAESAAHFTATAELKPSIFDIVAQSSLNSTLHPAFQKVATVSILKSVSAYVAFFKVSSIGQTEAVLLVNEVPRGSVFGFERAPAVSLFETRK